MKTPDARLLHLLRHAGEPLLLSELVAATGLTPEALEAQIAGLREAGFVIEWQPHLGCRLLETPDRLIPDDLHALLGPEGSAVAREIIVFEETGSTNDLVARMARGGAEEGVALFAERQHAGRGRRLGRTWASAAHLGLWFSLLLRPRFPLSEWPRLTTWAAVAVARGIEAAVPGSRVGIKWPNDLYLKGRKVVGILIEGSAGEGGGGYAIAGIGVNVNHLAGDFPPELADRAGSLRMSIGPEAAPLERPLIAAALLRELGRLYEQLHDDFTPILAEAESRTLLRGEWIKVTTPQGEVEGVAEGLEPDGRLRVRCADGTLAVFSGSEEVVLSYWQR